MSALVSPAFAMVMVPARPYGDRRVSLAGDDDRPRAAFATMSALASTAFAMVMVPARPYGDRRVSLAGDDDRPRAAFATMSAHLPCIFSAPKRIVTGAAVASTSSDCVADGALSHRDCSVGSGKRAHVDRHPFGCVVATSKAAVAKSAGVTHD